MAEMKPFQVEIRFSAVTADTLGPVIRAASFSRARYILVMTDLFTKFVVTVPLVQTTAADVTQAIVEH